MKLKSLDIILILLYIAIFKIYAIPQLAQQISKIIIVLIVFLYLLQNVKIKDLINYSLLFSMMIILSGVSSYRAGFVSFDRVLDGIMYAICMYCLYTVIQYCAQKDYMDKCIRILFNMTLIYCVVSFVSIIMVGTSNIGTEKTYFFGNKFITSYLFIMLAALFYVRCYNKIKNKIAYKIINLALCILAMVIGWWVNCTTALVGSVLLIIAYFLPETMRKILMDPKVVIAGILMAGLLIFGIMIILENERVRYIVVDILKEDLSLTGRTTIYKRLLEIISKRKWLGYGYNSNIVRTIVGYGNAQNGLMELAVNYGIIGVAFFVFTVWHCLKNKKEMEEYGLQILIYIMIVCSIVEITYDYIFYMALFLIRWFQGPQALQHKVQRKRIRIYLKNR